MNIDEEPELFAGAVADEPISFREDQEPEPEPVAVQSRTPTFLERLMAKRNKKKQETQRVEPRTETYAKSANDFGGDEVFDEEEKLNLDIPSFLRRS
jgi:hypothetical protein